MLLKIVCWYFTAISKILLTTVVNALTVHDVSRFGGGPEIGLLRQCPSCLRTHEAVVRRQCHEMNAFIIVSFTSERFALVSISCTCDEVNTQMLISWPTSKFTCISQSTHKQFCQRKEHN